MEPVFGVIVAFVVFLVLHLTQFLIVWVFSGIGDRLWIDHAYAIAYAIFTSPELVRPAVYIGMSIGFLAFLVPFVPFCVVWGLVAILLWFALWTSCHLPGLQHVAPTTTLPHLKFFIWTPVRSALQFVSLTVG